jgi:hypothetical protein
MWQWFAGLFEGEGHIAFTGVNSVELTLGSTDEDVIRRVHEAVGRRGRVYWRKRAKAHWSDAWIWDCTDSSDVEHILRKIAPHLCRRRGDRARAAQERLSKCRRKGFCKRGHPMSGENLYVPPNRGHPQCKACRTMHSRRRHAGFQENAHF